MGSPSPLCDVTLKMRWCSSPCDKRTPVENLCPLVFSVYLELIFQTHCPAIMFLLAGSLLVVTLCV